MKQLPIANGLHDLSYLLWLFSPMKYLITNEPYTIHASKMKNTRI